LKYLLDTVTISEIIKSSPNQKVIDWLQAQSSADLYLSSITIGEIRKGIELAKPQNLAFAENLERFLDMLTQNYQERILPFDEAAAQIWGRFMALYPNIGIEDSQIGAIAVTHDLTVATRNIKDFAPMGVPHFNPF
jgi:predicted nucleic acid-binding protein